MQRRQLSMQHSDAAFAVDADIGMLMTARGMRDSRQHKLDCWTIQSGQVPGQVDRVATSQGGDDPQNPLLPARQGTDGVLVDPGRVQPPPPRLVSRLNPRMARRREPAARVADQQLHRRLQWVHSLRPGPQPGMIHTHHESLSLVGNGGTTNVTSTLIPAGSDACCGRW